MPITEVPPPTGGRAASRTTALSPNGISPRMTRERWLQMLGDIARAALAERCPQPSEIRLKIIQHLVSAPDADCERVGKRVLQDVPPTPGHGTVSVSQETYRGISLDVTGGMGNAVRRRLQFPSPSMSMMPRKKPDDVPLPSPISPELIRNPSASEDYPSPAPAVVPLVEQPTTHMDDFDLVSEDMLEEVCGRGIDHNQFTAQQGGVADRVPAEKGVKTDSSYSEGMVHQNHEESLEGSESPHSDDATVLRAMWDRIVESRKCLSRYTSSTRRPLDDDGECEEEEEEGESEEEAHELKGDDDASSASPLADREEEWHRLKALLLTSRDDDSSPEQHQLSLPKRRRRRKATIVSESPERSLEPTQSSSSSPDDVKESRSASTSVQGVLQLLQEVGRKHSLTISIDEEDSHDEGDNGDGGDKGGEGNVGRVLSCAPGEVLEDVIPPSDSECDGGGVQEVASRQSSPPRCASSPSPTMLFRVPPEEAVLDGAPCDVVHEVEMAAVDGPAEDDPLIEVVARVAAQQAEQQQQQQQQQQPRSGAAEEDVPAEPTTPRPTLRDALEQCRRMQPRDKGGMVESWIGRQLCENTSPAPVGTPLHPVAAAQPEAVERAASYSPPIRPQAIDIVHEDDVLQKAVEAYSDGTLLKQKDWLENDPILEEPKGGEEKPAKERRKEGGGKAPRKGQRKKKDDGPTENLLAWKRKGGRTSGYKRARDEKLQEHADLVIRPDAPLCDELWSPLEVKTKGNKKGALRDRTNLKAVKRRKVASSTGSDYDPGKALESLELADVPMTSKDWSRQGGFRGMKGRFWAETSFALCKDRVHDEETATAGKKTKRTRSGPKAKKRGKEQKDAGIELVEPTEPKIPFTPHGGGR